MDFRDKYERELLDAFDRHIAKPTEGERRNRFFKPSGRLIVLLLVSMAGVGTAFAAFVWDPLLGTGKFDEPVPTVSRAAPPESQLSLLGILRRPQAATDRGEAASQALRFLTGASSHGVELDYLRVLDDSGATLIPTSSVTERGGVGELQDALCLFVPSTDDGGARTCWSTSDVRNGDAFAEASSGVFGLVPDPVSAVQITFRDGTRVKLGVKNNFFHDHTSGLTDAQQIRWFDAQGFDVGPPLK